MTADRIEVGKCRCPLCRNEKAAVRVNVKQLAYIMCNACNTQIQARSERSDELIRALVLAAPAKEPAPAPEPKPAPVPVRTETAQPAAPAPASGMTWGVLRG